MHFSEATKQWLRHQESLRTAERQFRLELERMLVDIQDRFHAKQWRSNLGGDPASMIQLYRSGWPSGWGGLHYEIDSPEDLLRQGRLLLGVHVEEEVPNQTAVKTALCRLLQPHEDRLSSRCGCRIQDGASHLVHGALDILSLTCQGACDAVQALMETETFAEEAMFLAGKKTVWRTDLLADQPKPNIHWTKGGGDAPIGGTGGWEFRENGGRLDTPCLTCRGDPDNYNYRDGQNIVTLFETSRQFQNGQRVYACAVLLAPKGGRFTFHAEAGREGKWRTAFRRVFHLVPVDRWQVVSFEGQISNPEDCDFASHGLHVHVMVTAPESGLTLDAIEIGSCE